MMSVEPTQPDPPRPCFIVGCPRSGTSLVQRLVASHPQIVTGPESLFFKDFYLWLAPEEGGALTPRGRYRQRLMLYRLGFRLGFIHQLARERLVTMLTDIGSDPALIQQAQRCRRVSRLIKLFIRGMDDFAAKHDAKVWIEKTPDHINYIPQILEHLPDARFIHVVRDAKDAVASLHDASIKYPGTHWARRYCSLERCCDRWNKTIGESLRYLGHNHHFITPLSAYIDQTSSTLQDADRFLGLAPRGQVDPQNNAPQVKREYEDWKSDVYSPPRQPEDKFSQLFDASQQELILKLTREMQSQLDQGLAHLAQREERSTAPSP